MERAVLVSIPVTKLMTACDCPLHFVNTCEFRILADPPAPAPPEKVLSLKAEQRLTPEVPQ